MTKQPRATKMVHAAQAIASGFTVIELATTIAIIGVISAVSYPQVKGMLAGADKQSTNDFAMQIQSAGQIYANKNFRKPNGLNEFVSSGAVSGAQTISLNSFGRADKSCTIAPAVINCTQATNNLDSVSFYWDHGKVYASFEGQVAQAPENNGIVEPNAIPAAPSPGDVVDEDPASHGGGNANNNLHMSSPDGNNSEGSNASDDSSHHDGDEADGGSSDSGASNDVKGSNDSASGVNGGGVSGNNLNANNSMPSESEAAAENDAADGGGDSNGVVDTSTIKLGQGMYADSYENVTIYAVDGGYHVLGSAEKSRYGNFEENGFDAFVDWESKELKDGLSYNNVTYYGDDGVDFLGTGVGQMGASSYAAAPWLSVTNSNFEMGAGRDEVEFTLFNGGKGEIVNSIFDLGSNDKENNRFRIRSYTGEMYDGSDTESHYTIDNVKIVGGYGADNIEISSSSWSNPENPVEHTFSVSNVHIDSGDGDDYVGLSVWGNGSNSKDEFSDITILTGDGKDYIGVSTKSPGKDIVVDAGRGDDMIYANATSNAVIKGGEGFDTVYLNTYDYDSSQYVLPTFSVDKKGNLLVYDAQGNMLTIGSDVELVQFSAYDEKTGWQQYTIKTSPDNPVQALMDSLGGLFESLYKAFTGQTEEESPAAEANAENVQVYQNQTLDYSKEDYLDIRNNIGVWGDAPQLSEALSYENVKVIGSVEGNNYLSLAAGIDYFNPNNRKEGGYAAGPKLSITNTQFDFKNPKSGAGMLVTAQSGGSVDVTKTVVTLASEYWNGFYIDANSSKDSKSIEMATQLKVEGLVVDARDSRTSASLNIWGDNNVNTTYAMHEVSMLGGTSDDYLRFDLADGPQYEVNNVTLEGGMGNDYLNLNLPNTGSVKNIVANAGDGDDSIYMWNLLNSGEGLTVDGGDGKDILYTQLKLADIEGGALKGQARINADGTITIGKTLFKNVDVIGFYDSSWQWQTMDLIDVVKKFG